MEIKIDLKQYAGSAAIAEGQLFHKTCKVEIRDERMVNGHQIYKIKTFDQFNFVNTVSLDIADMGRKIARCSCNCRTAKETHRICKHGVAALIELMHCDGSAGMDEFNDYRRTIETTSTVVEDEWKPEPVSEVEEEAPVISIAQASDFEEEVSIPEETADISEDVISEEPEGYSAEDTGVPEDEENLPEDEEILPEDEAVPEEAEEVFSPRSMNILFGHDMETEEAIIWRPNDTEQVFHTNTGIIGTMGTGKTQFTKSLITQLYREQVNNYDGSQMGILIFDYKGDYNETKPDFVKAVNARVLKPYRLPYNPFALKKGRSFLPLLPMHTANAFKDTVSKIYNLGPKQQQNLLDCIFEAYKKQGISPENSLTWNRKAPTFDQVYKIYIEQFGSKTPDSLTAAMNKLQQFCIFGADPNRAISLAELLKGVVVIDLSGYEDDIQNLIVAITLDQFYSQMQFDGSSQTDGKMRQQRYMILVDEADNFMSQGFPSLRKILKEGREFGVGIVLSTQSLTHFVGEDNYSRYVLTWVVHNVSDLSQRDVEYIFKFKPKSPEIQKVYAEIKGLEKHQSMVKIANEDQIIMRDKPFWQIIKE